MELAFIKAEGLGNDFIVVESATFLESDPRSVLRIQKVRQLCDRNYGIGADGVLQIWPEDKHWRLRIHNADASIPEMCGNGVRCVAVALLERQRIRFEDTLHIESDAGPIECSFVSKSEIKVNMGAVTIEEYHSGKHDDEGQRGIYEMALSVTRRLLGDDVLDAKKVSVGNPHWVIRVQDLPSVEILGALQKEDALQELFPNGVNISAYCCERDHLEALVWERGVGPTKACGTAACAIAHVQARHDTSCELINGIHVHLPGGGLCISSERTEMQGAICWMQAPAHVVFQGSIKI